MEGNPLVQITMMDMEVEEMLVQSLLAVSL